MVSLRLKLMHEVLSLFYAHAQVTAAGGEKLCCQIPKPNIRTGQLRAGFDYEPPLDTPNHFSNLWRQRTKKEWELCGYPGSLFMPCSSLNRQQ